MRFLSIFSLVLGLSLASCSNGFKIEDEYGLTENDLQHLVKEVKLETIKEIGTDIDVIFTGINIQPSYGKMKQQDIMVYGSVFYNYGPNEMFITYVAFGDGKVDVFGEPLPIALFNR